MAVPFEGKQLGVDTPSVAGSGSLEVSIPWNVGSPTDQAVMFGTFDNEYGYDGTETLDGTKYTNIVMDVYVDPTSPVNQNNNCSTLNVGFAKRFGGRLRHPDDLECFSRDASAQCGRCLVSHCGAD